METFRIDPLSEQIAMSTDLRASNYSTPADYHDNNVRNQQIVHALREKDII